MPLTQTTQINNRKHTNQMGKSVRRHKWSKKIVIPSSLNLTEQAPMSAMTAGIDCDLTLLTHRTQLRGAHLIKLWGYDGNGSASLSVEVLAAIVNIITRSSLWHALRIPSVKYWIPNELTAVTGGVGDCDSDDLSTINRLRSSMTTINFAIVSRRRSLRSESPWSFERSTSTSWLR